ncbi:MAG: hypothetical protein RL367_1261 [Pseudomonadota bacterium]
MPAYVALLRAVNVGGTGKLPMTDLQALCVDAGFGGVKTYIASGNVVFNSPLSEAQVQAILQDRLQAYAGKPVGVFIRTATQMAAVLAANPLADHPPNRTVAIFLNAPPPADLIEGISHQCDEIIRPGLCEIYVTYPGGMGTSKLKIKAASAGTARNMNTISRLAAMALAL